MLTKFLVALLAVGCLGCGSSTKPAANTARLPFGALDSPVEGASIKGITVVDGWALSEDGIDHVAIYLDRNYLQDAAVKGRREDVVKVFPAFAKVDDMRFSTELNAASLPEGRHELSARAISRKGATRDFLPHIINIEH